MKSLILSLGFIFVSLGVCAGQGTGYVRQRLARAGGYGEGRIEVVESPDAAVVVARADGVLHRTSMTVYGVSLFRDNSQTARSNAEAVKAEFEGMFPETGVELKYESPYFKVTAGRFVDRTDAVALCGRVVGVFPKAVVVQEEINISENIN